jgi:hypothetical protein
VVLSVQKVRPRAAFPRLARRAAAEVCARRVSAKCGKAAAAAAASSVLVPLRASVGVRSGVRYGWRALRVLVVYGGAYFAALYFVL